MGDTGGGHNITLYYAESSEAPDNGWLIRLRAERAELGKRVAALNSFVGTEAYGRLPYVERLDLSEQAFAMTYYLDVLDRRLSRAAV
jgi:hypothetical protein